MCPTLIQPLSAMLSSEMETLISLHVLLFCAAILCTFICSFGAHTVPACDSEVFCSGDLLRAVKLAAIFNDSKEFVDRPLRANPTTVLQAFQAISPNDATGVRQFVLNWTEEAGSDLVKWVPPDWVESPDFLAAIQHRQLKELATDLNKLWMELGREVGPSVFLYPDRHSLLAVPHPFIVPGGRFREFYYWDSYWVVSSLLQCGMNSTARGMIENLAFMVDRYGLVPNGGRVYYTRRSQPPLLTQMVQLYFNATGNSSFLEAMLPMLVNEYQFWMSNRTVQVRGHTFNQYAVPGNTPRPESYWEDIEIAASVSENERPLLYSNIASAAESGWDFSSRWVSPSGPLAGQLSSTRTKRIVPVDLNAILCQNEATLAHLFTVVGNTSAAATFSEALQRRQAAFDAIFWNETDGLWKDWDQDRQAHLQGFYASSLVPLLWGCGPTNTTKHEMVLHAVNKLGLLDFPGGIPTSNTTNSTLQWDFPNAWAPLQWFPVVGWCSSPSDMLREAAHSIAQTWVTTVLVAWENSNKTVFEKYNCTELGVPGGGGEYIVQTGFGWTNAVVLHFLALYPDLTPAILPPSKHQPSLGWISVLILLVLSVAVATPCVLWCRWIYRRGKTRYWARVHNEHLMVTSGGRASPTMYTNPYADNGLLGEGGREYLHFDA